MTGLAWPRRGGLGDKVASRQLSRGFQLQMRSAVHNAGPPGRNLERRLYNIFPTVASVFWPLGSLQGPDKGLGFPGSVCVVCVFTRPLRSTSEAKAVTAWCKKNHFEFGFFWDFILLLRSSISALHFQRSGLELPRTAVSTAAAVL